MMHTPQFSYPYVSLEAGEAQYKEIPFAVGGTVDARYLKAICPEDEGNPFIEALPYPFTTVQEIVDAYSVPIEYTEEERNLPSAEREFRVSLLRKLRFPLPFHLPLEKYVYDALCRSYRIRHLKHQSNPFYYSLSNEKMVSYNRLSGAVDEATNEGIAILGYSGCGKSSSIHTLLKKYPQVIIHWLNGNRIPQIVYLVVTCLPNSNFSALYASIGHAIDAALDTGNIYEREIEKIPTLGKKLRKVRELIEAFSIGTIIFDEIQLIDFASTKENSFESLMVLANETKVAIILIGTEDAYSKMLPNLRTARRIGTIIRGSDYCANKEYFSYLVKSIFHYQWFDEKVEVTQEIIDAMYNNTRGIIDQLIGLYIDMHRAYLAVSPSHRPVVNTAFIEDVSRRYHSGIRNLLEDLSDPSPQIQFQKELQLAYNQVKQAQAIINESCKIPENVLLREVIKRIRSIVPDLSSDEIATAFQKVLQANSVESKNVDAIAPAVFKELQSSHTETPPVKKKSSKKQRTVSHDSMREQLLNP